MSGWIKIHRQVLDWEWYNEPYMFRLFTHLLLKANHKPKKWKGVDVKRGQLITGREKLSAETGISQQTIRTCLNRLKSTNEITIKSTNRFSIITICNYDHFQQTDETTNQQINQQTNQQLTSNQPAINQQLTTNKNEKNVRKKEENIHQRFNALLFLKERNVSQKTAEAWLRARSKKRLANTDIAFERVIKEAEKAKMSLQEALTISAENGWGGFKAEWVNSNNENKGKVINGYTFD